MLDFNTMEKDVKERTAGLPRDGLRGPYSKMTRDPRRTAIGGFIHRWSLDKLPQLWNVFKGEMSIVGPRPPLPAEVKVYAPWQRRRMSMRPGLTCIWQTSGCRMTADPGTWMRLDLEYIDNWSLWLDVKILLKTIPALLAGNGAE